MKLFNLKNTIFKTVLLVLTQKVTANGFYHGISKGLQFSGVLCFSSLISHLVFESMLVMKTEVFMVDVSDTMYILGFQFVDR